MRSLETQYVRRAYDGKYEKVVKVMDEENKYSYKTDSGGGVTLVPTKWVTVDVLDGKPRLA